MITIDDFHKHIDKCSRCAQDPYNLCAVGAELLKDAAASLPPLREVFPNLPFVPEWGEIEKQFLGKKMKNCTTCSGVGSLYGVACTSCGGTGRVL